MHPRRQLVRLIACCCCCWASALAASEAPTLSHICSASHSRISLQLLLAGGGQGTAAAAECWSQQCSGLVNVSKQCLANGSQLLLVTVGRPRNREALVLRLEAPRLRLLLYWPIGGFPSCQSAARRTRPGLLVIGGQNSTVELFVDNLLSDGPELQVTVGESRRTVKVTQLGSWYRSSLDASLQDIRKITLDFSSGWYEADFSKTPQDTFGLPSLDQCGKGENRKESTDGRSLRQDAILVVCLCCAIAAILTIVAFASSRFRRRSALAIRVALAGDVLRGCAGGLRRRLAAEAKAKAGLGQRVTFEVASLEGLRASSCRYDLVLLFLGPGDPAAPPNPELDALVAVERWRFRLVMLAPAPGCQDAASEPLILRVPGGVRVGVCGGGGGDDCPQEWAEELFHIVSRAWREDAGLGPLLAASRS